MAGDHCIHPASVHDAMAGRIAADLGFELGMLAGSTASLTVLGAPDLIVLTLTEFADQARRITRAGAPPLLCDADHGYGNALNVMRTVQELETAGVAGFSLEDTELPRPFGEAGVRLISLNEGLGKIRAGLAAREDASMVIMARTGAVGITGMEDALERARAYDTCGADVLFFTGITERAQLEALSAATTLPIMLGGLNAALTDKPYLASQRVRIALQGHQAIAASMAAVHATLKQLRDGVAPGELTGVPPADFMKRVTREAEYAQWTRDFLENK
ncbi:MAG: isocitrate lyase/PEP mutase family protein [Pseudomonadota bacterium]